MSQNRNTQKRKPRRGLPFNPFNVMWFIIAAVIIGWWLVGDTNSPSESSWNEVEQMVEKGQVEKIVVVNRDVARVYLTPQAIE